MLALGIDTATGDLVVGVGDVDKQQALAESITETRAHNERLMPAVVAALAESGIGFGDLGAVVVGCGPGPFTGLRVGMASASALGQALRVPVYGVVTHDAVAAQIDADRVLVVTDARRREVYWALYERGRRVAGPDVCAPGAVPVERADVVSAPPHLAGQLEVAAREVVHVSPNTLGLLRAADFTAEPGPLVPHYLRRPDAVEPKAQRKSPAIP